MTRPLSHQALAQVLSQAERSVARRLAELLEANGGTIEQWRVLSLLADGHGHAMKELADFVFVPPPTLTRIIDRMITESLVYRRVDAEDRRRVLIFASARGRKQHARLQRDIDTYEAGLDGDLDLGTLTDLLNRLVERME